jgi:hypothetical protein
VNAQSGELRWPLEICHRGTDLNGPYALVVGRRMDETAGWYITRDVKGALPTIGMIGRVIEGRPTEMSSVRVVPANSEEAAAFLCWLDYTRYMRLCQAQLLADLLPDRVIGQSASKVPKSVMQLPAIYLDEAGTRTLRVSRRRIWVIDRGIRAVWSDPTEPRLKLIRELEAAAHAVAEWMDYLECLSKLVSTISS